MINIEAVFYEKIKNIDNVLVYTENLTGCGVLSINIKGIRITINKASIIII